MWYELLPGLGIMCGVTMACLNVGIFEKWIVAKGKSPRLGLSTQEMYCIKRDEELTGCKYRVQGLEALPDLD